MTLPQLITRYTTSIFASGLVLLAAANLRAQQSAPTVESLISGARAAAGTDWTGTFSRLCIPPSAGGGRAGGGRGASGGRGGGGRGAPARDTWYAEPAKVADNLYFLGTRIHSSWALVGSDGIIVIEALFDYAAKDEILDGMAKMGLDKNKVKYVLLSHAHADHDGGAKLLQDSMPNAHLLYGAEDWDAVDKSTNHAGGKPKHDLVADDGMRVTVGDATVRVVTMPGHTAGTLSYLFEVKDHGKPMKIAYVGGTAISFTGSADYYDGYIRSSAKMAKAAADFGATALLSNHSEFDDAYFKAHAASDRKLPETPNPFEVGAGGVQHYFTMVQGCAAAAKLRTGAQ